MNRQLAEKRGRRAETLAVWYLRLKGYAVLARRVKTNRGEIDIIARRGKSLVFVEVKARQSLDAGHDILTRQTLARVKAAVDVLADRYGRYTSIRIDAILIAPRSWPRHIENIGLDI